MAVVDQSPMNDSYRTGSHHPMAFPNPAMKPPVLTSARRSLHSRSPSRSPVRHVRDVEPLLCDLSPTTTVRTLTNETASKHDSAQGALAHSFETASSYERALGVKAAQTCLDLRSWTRELESWEWPGTFDVPEPTQKMMRTSGLSILSARTAGQDGDDGEEEFWGSLPGKTAQEYEKRADEIGQQLEGLDVEEMKGVVLSAHRRAGDGSVSLQDGIGAVGAHTDLRRLDDFTALITATILQALPYLSRLTRLLDVWSMRLAVLRQAPSYLHDLKQARTDLDHGWAAIAVSPTSGNDSSSANFTRDNMREMKCIIDQQVNGLGRRLDGFLDDLEGREETVPEAWIEDFETLESAYGDWVVQAGRKVLENEWRTAREEQDRNAERLKTEQQLTAPRPEHEGRGSEPNHHKDHKDHSQDLNPLVVPSSRPTSGMLDLLPEQQMHDLLLPVEIPREDSQTLAQDEEGQIQHPNANSVHMVLVSAAETGSPTKRARHMPIVIDYSNPSQLHPSQLHPSQLHPSQPVPQVIDRGILNTIPAIVRMKGDGDSTPQPTTSNNTMATKRAAFVNGDVERAESLQRQVKSPVRPFEHASNAFTRLFKKDKSPEQSRSNSYRSTASQGSSASKRDSNTSTDGVIWGGRKNASPSANGQSLNPREAYSRSRSASQRSSDSKGNFKGALVDAVPTSVPRQRSFQRDYMDLPGGFRSRSGSDGSRRTRSSVTPRLEYDGLERRLERLPEAAVETYQPKRRLSSPFRPPSSSKAKQQEAEYPADWPLASPPETVPSSPVKEMLEPSVQEEVGPSANAQEAEDDDSPGIHSPGVPMDTDAFDKIFVESLPATPEPEFEGNPLARVPPRSRSALGLGMSRKESAKSRVPTLDESMLGPEEEQWSPRIPETEKRGEDVTSSIGNTSAPDGEIQNTSYFHVQPSPPSAVSRKSSLDTAKAHSRKATSPGSPMPLKLQIPGSPATAQAGTEATNDHDAEAKPSLPNRASIASIESHPRSALRSIELPRRASQGSAPSVPQTPVEPLPALEATRSAKSTPGSPLNYKGLVVFPSPPRANGTNNSSGSAPASPVSPISRQQSPSTKSRFATTPIGNRVRGGVPDSPVSARSDGDSPAPLNAAMGKMQGNARGAKGVASSRSSKQATPLKPGEDTFDRHVSEVLNRLPSHAIKFRTRAGAVTPIQRTAEPRNYSGPRPNGGPRIVSRAETGGLTLAPADSAPKKSAADEVKLYHLRQAGREEPIKLFVRLVGDGERVMVRVGGGWADLADYLRQYAEHHGSRTVSGGGIELQTAKSTGPGSRKVSGTSAAAGGATEPKTRGTPVTPATAAARPGSRAAEMNWFKLDEPVASSDDSPPSNDSFSPVADTQPQHGQTPVHAVGTQRSTPKSASTKGSSRPSTADSTGRPDNRQGWSDAGLAGLAGRANGKRADLPAQKARWVEGMIEKAKAASAEKSKEEKSKFFGELGKAGGARRMIFRQSSAAGGANVGGAENAKP